MTLPLYSLRSAPSGSYTLHKLADTDDECAIYHLTPRGRAFACDCPANSRAVVLHLCKHRKMLPLMLAKVDTGAMYEPTTKTWVPSLIPDNWRDHVRAANIACDELSSTAVPIQPPTISTLRRR